MKGICFIEPMFMATIKGRKNQTRRMPKLPMPFDNLPIKSHTLDIVLKANKAYKPGEILYLKEPYFYNNLLHKTLYKFKPFDFPFDDNQTYKNKLFMPAKYARYFIKIKGIRIEKLGYIKETDCINEGVQTDGVITPYEAYMFLWNFINGKNAWERDKDKYVFVYDYELIQKEDITKEFITKNLNYII